MANPKQLISNQFAIELNQNYINQRSPIIRAALGRDDADAAWFSFEEIENYIAYVKTEAAAKNYDLDGIRIYLGVYPQDSSQGSKAGMTTVFFSPTGQRIGSPSGTGHSMSPDIAEIQPLNYGGVGHPPIIDYPLL